MDKVTTTSTDNYDGGVLVEIMDNFVNTLQQHLREGIDVLLERDSLR